jgi:hypothetical protein
MSEDQSIQGNVKTHRISDKLKKFIEEIATRIKTDNKISDKDSNLITDITINEIIETTKSQEDGILRKNPNGGYFFDETSLKSDIELKQYFIDTYEDIIIKNRKNIKEMIKIEIKKMKLIEEKNRIQLAIDINISKINNIKKIKKELKQKEEDTNEQKLKNLAEMYEIIERDIINILEESKVSNDEINNVRVTNSELLKQITRIDDNLRKSKKHVNKEQLEIANLDSEINSTIREYYNTHNTDLINQQQKIYNEKKNAVDEATRKEIEDFNTYTEALNKTQVDGLNSLTTAFNNSTEALNNELSELNKGFSNGLTEINNTMMGISNQFLGLQVVIAQNAVNSLNQTYQLEDITIKQANTSRRMAIEQQYQTSIASATEIYANALSIKDIIGDDLVEEARLRATHLGETANQQRETQIEELERQQAQTRQLGESLLEQKSKAEIEVLRLREQLE